MEGMLDGIGTALAAMGILLLVFIPLGAWKMIELIMEFLSHIQWVSGG